MLASPVTGVFYPPTDSHRLASPPRISSVPIIFPFLTRTHFSSTAVWFSGSTVFSEITSVKVTNLLLFILLMETSVPLPLGGQEHSERSSPLALGSRLSWTSANLLANFFSSASSLKVTVPQALMLSMPFLLTPCTFFCVTERHLRPSGKVTLHCPLI